MFVIYYKRPIDRSLQYYSTHPLILDLAVIGGTREDIFAALDNAVGNAKRLDVKEFNRNQMKRILEHASYSLSSIKMDREPLNASHKGDIEYILSKVRRSFYYC